MTRLGRFFTTDPLQSRFPWNSPYVFSENRVLDGIELEGLEWVDIHYYERLDDNGKLKMELYSVGVNDNSMGKADNGMGFYYHRYDGNTIERHHADVDIIGESLESRRHRLTGELDNLNTEVNRYTKMKWATDFLWLDDMGHSNGITNSGGHSTGRFEEGQLGATIAAEMMSHRYERTIKALKKEILPIEAALKEIDNLIIKKNKMEPGEIIETLPVFKE